jgi:hypothetical protein
MSLGDPVVAQTTPTPAKDVEPPDPTAFPGNLPADLPKDLPWLKPSTIEAELLKYKEEHPSASPQKIAEYGNSLLPLKGYNYNIDVEGLNRKKVKETRRISEYYLAYPYTMTLSGGKKQNFLFFAPSSESCCCGYYYTDVPVTAITANTLTLISDGKTYTVNRPADLGQSEVHALIDVKNPSKEIRKWQVPRETYPMGISEDGTKLYIDGPVEDVFLEISADGSFKFAAKNEIRSDEGTPCSIRRNRKDDYETCIKFKAGQKTYHIKFSGPCT